MDSHTAWQCGNVSKGAGRASWDPRLQLEVGPKLSYHRMADVSGQVHQVAGWRQVYLKGFLLLHTYYCFSSNFWDWCRLKLGNWNIKESDNRWINLSDCFFIIEFIIYNEYFNQSESGTFNQCIIMHYRLRPIKRGQFKFANFAPNFEGKCHFHFLIHWILLKFL